MNQEEFNVLAADLKKIAGIIPLNWGAVQQNCIDDSINMFSIATYSELERKVSPLSEFKKNYFRRRCYSWTCAECDEYLFYKNANVEKNPNHCDKAWDVRINQNHVFDIKGTVIPREMRNDVEAVMDNPGEMVEFFYEKQSKGVRYDIQNRLFIIHHSFVDADRELYLRCAWEEKERIYKEFCSRIDDISFISTHNVEAGVIFVLERVKNVVEYKIAGLG